MGRRLSSQLQQPFVANGWTIVFGARFEERYRKLVDRVEKLNQSLPRKKYEGHPEVKLLAAVHRLVTSLIPADPNTRDFLLEDELSKFRRVKKHGLPERFRLFYTFSSVQRVIIPLYLNDSNTLRKRGAGSDPYEVFKRMVGQGNIGSDFEANWNEWVSANRGWRNSMVSLQRRGRRA
ncbi:MAG: type II toxin-antitoxin system YhaV family toxin [Candidatus Dormibacteraceae bacterium]